MLSPAFVGNTHVFSAPVEACDNCGMQSQQAQLVSNTTPLTDQLLDYVASGYLESMRPEHVNPFLIKNLKWRVIAVSFQFLCPICGITNAFILSRTVKGFLPRNSLKRRILAFLYPARLRRCLERRAKSSTNALTMSPLRSSGRRRRVNRILRMMNSEFERKRSANKVAHDQNLISNTIFSCNFVKTVC